MKRVEQRMLKEAYPLPNCFDGVRILKILLPMKDKGRYA